MISSALLILFIVFVLVDALLGLRRGMYPALIRFAMIFVCAVTAFLCARYLGDNILNISIGSISIGDWFNEFLHGNRALDAALSYSETVEELVMHMPQVITKEILFVPIFFVIRLLTLLLMIPVKRFFKLRAKENAKEAKETAQIDAEYYDAATKENAADGTAEANESVGTEATEDTSQSEPPSFEKSFWQRKKSRLIGLTIGIVQGLLCFTIVMVPVFGICEVGSAAIDEFQSSNISEMRDLCRTVDENIVEPIETSFVAKVLGAVGIRSLALSTFRGLSHATLEYGDVVKDAYYFETLEAAYPAVSAFLLLQDMDPRHMRQEDYTKLNEVFATAKASEEVAAVLVDVTSSLVETYVGDQYRNAAETVTEVFVDYVLSTTTDTENLDLALELDAIQNVLGVMDSATTAGTSSAFDNKNVDTVVDTLLDTNASYETVISIAKDENKSAVLKEEIVMGDLTKERTKEELLKYRDQKINAVSSDQQGRVNELVNSVAGLLGIDLNS